MITQDHEKIQTPKTNQAPFQRMEWTLSHRCVQLGLKPMNFESNQSTTLKNQTRKSKKIILRGSPLLKSLSKTDTIYSQT